MTNPDTGNGVLSGGSRPPFFRYVLRLYAGDQVFRGLIDFAAIGAIVLLFLHPPSMNWFRGWMEPKATSLPKRSEPTHPPAPAQPTSVPSQQTAAVTEPAPRSSGPTSASAGVPMPAIGDAQHPRLQLPILIEIDEKAFQSSDPADQQRLIKAAQAHQAFRYSEMFDHLAGARSSDPNVAYMRGLAALYQMDSRHYARAVEQLRAASAGGHLQGKRLIETAAAKGDRMAQRFAGMGHLGGEFGALNPFKAADFFKRAVAAGDVAAMPYYAHMLFRGAGVDKDEAAAEQLIERAAGAGLTVAQETLGNWILDRYAAGVIDSPSDGVRWLERAYQQGFSITALTRLAVFYGDQGRGSWRDRAKAFELFRLGAAFSHWRPHFGYATGFQFGYTGAKDPVKAYTHYEVARQLGSLTAPTRQKALEDLLSPSEKASALEAARLLRRELKPTPRMVLLQSPDVPLPPSPWAENLLDRRISR